MRNEEKWRIFVLIGTLVFIIRPGVEYLEEGGRFGTFAAWVGMGILWGVSTAQWALRESRTQVRGASEWLVFIPLIPFAIIAVLTLTSRIPPVLAFVVVAVGFTSAMAVLMYPGTKVWHFERFRDVLPVILFLLLLCAGYMAHIYFHT